MLDLSSDERLTVSDRGQSFFLGCLIEIADDGHIDIGQGGRGREPAPVFDVQPGQRSDRQAQTDKQSGLSVCESDVEGITKPARDHQQGHAEKK